MLGNNALPNKWPAIFFTLSAADTVWPDFMRACRPELSEEKAKRLPARARQRLLNENPGIATRHFQRRFKAFFDEVLNGEAKPLGEITDYFCRIEFQKRGSPHVHGLLWVDGAPDVLACSKSEAGRKKVTSFVDKHIASTVMSFEELAACTCQRCKSGDDKDIDILAQRPSSSSLSSKVSQCDLLRVVRRVQQHACVGNSTCRQKTGCCRFGFTKPLQKHDKCDCEST